MDGPSRAVLYALLLGTGLRVGEAKSLCPESFDLGESATVQLEAAYSKRRRTDVLPLPSWLVARLAVWLDGKPVGQPIFNLRQNRMEMFYADLERAGVDRDTVTGRIDMHSLRHTFVSNVVRGGASIKVGQELARHSSVTLTLGIYAHARLHDVVGAVEGLPDPFPAKPEVESAVQAATGTDGPIGAQNLAAQLGQRAGVESGPFLSSDDSIEVAELQGGVDANFAENAGVKALSGDGQPDSAGRTTDLPWANISQLAVTLNQSASLCPRTSPSEASTLRINGATGPPTLSKGLGRKLSNFGGLCCVPA
jgi:hypothetical protein